MTTLTKERVEMVGAVALVHREIDDILRIIIAELVRGTSPLTLALQIEVLRLDIAERLTNVSTAVALETCDEDVRSDTTTTE